MYKRDYDHIMKEIGVYITTNMYYLIGSNLISALEQSSLE